MHELDKFVETFSALGENHKNNYQGEFLLEMGVLHSTIIPKYLFKHVLENEGLRCVGFESNPKKLREKISYKIRTKINITNPNLDPIAIHKKIGIKKFLYPKVLYFKRFIYASRHKKIYNSLDNKNLIKFKYKSVLIGDLIHDHYLRYSLEEKVRIEDREFKKFFILSLNVFEFWEKYITNNNVKYVSSMHTIFLSALPMRICIKNGGYGLLISSERVFRLSKEQDQSDMEYFKYHEMFLNQFDDVTRKRALTLSNKKLLELSQGNSETDFTHILTNGFKSNNKLKKISIDNKKLNIVIFCHCFSDAPNYIPKNFFINFWDWLEFIAEYSFDKKYNWYIKSHPGFTESDWKHFKIFLSKYEHITEIPHDYGLQRLKKEGVNFGLTMYGTVGLDLAYLGVPVINASTGHPHISYNFTITPNSKKELGVILENLKNLKFRPSKKEIAEYYFMHNIRNTNNWFYSNFRDMINYVGGYSNQWNSEKVFEYINENFTKKDIVDNINTIRDFIQSQEYRLRYRRLNNYRVDLFQDF